MSIRSQNPALYRGIYSNTFVGHILFNCKWDVTTGNKVVFAANCDTWRNTVKYNVGGTKMTDLLTGNVISGNSGV